MTDRVNWKIGDVIGGRSLRPSRSLAAGCGCPAPAGSPCLTPAEKVKLTHVEMGAYAHLFGYVEEFIAPAMIDAGA